MPFFNCKTKTVLICSEYGQCALCLLCGFFHLIIIQNTHTQTQTKTSRQNNPNTENLYIWAIKRSRERNGITFVNIALYTLHWNRSIETYEHEQIPHISYAIQHKWMNEKRKSKNTQANARLLTHTHTHSCSSQHTELWNWTQGKQITSW